MSSLPEYVAEGYRLTLRRKLTGGDILSLLAPPPKTRRTVNFCMLNPSRADERLNDPTTIRCINFGKAWSFDDLVLTNLYAGRATHPRDLWKMDDPIGEGNDLVVLREASEADLIVAAWGAEVEKHAAARERAAHVLELLQKVGDVFCLGTTAYGSPRHPLMVPKRQEPMLYGRAA